MATTNQDALAKGAGDGPAQDAAQEPGQAEHGEPGDGGDGGDDGATDAGASSLPPSEIGGRAPLDTACSDADGGAPSSLAGGIVGPPSPLTGCYLLIVLGEPHSEEHKDNILQHLLKGEFKSYVPYLMLFHMPTISTPGTVEHNTMVSLSNLESGRYSMFLADLHRFVDPRYSSRKFVPLVCQ